MALILIKKLGTIKKDSKYRRYALFLCTFCNNEIERRLDTTSYSCGCATNYLLSVSNSGENNPMYGIVSPMCGKNHTNEAIKKQSESKKGTKNPMYGKEFTEEHKRKLSESHKGILIGKEFTEEHKRKLSESHKGKFGILSSNWQGGKSFEIYPQEFSKDLKKQILKRDDYKCQNLYCTTSNYYKLDVHHIDYDKKNNNLENLITLCCNCHGKTIGKINRNYYKNFYLELIKERMV